MSTTFQVTAYRTLWFGLQYDSETVEQGETVGNGALTTVRWYDGEPVGDGHLQGQFTALKDFVAAQDRFCVKPARELRFQERCFNQHLDKRITPMLVKTLATCGSQLHRLRKLFPEVRTISFTM